MSGDVQPRKRKDKKRKKDDLGVEEPRGTAAVLGEGDVFMHSQHEHGTGGHWCAKIIFFSLLAVLVTLIGLIILENRGLTEMEANSVESRYSGVLDGWIEDSPDDDHHDEHTLELLKQHDDDEDHDERSNHDENDSGIDDTDDDEQHDQEISNEDGENDDADEDDEEIDRSDEAQHADSVEEDENDDGIDGSDEDQDENDAEEDENDVDQNENDVDQDENDEHEDEHDVERDDNYDHDDDDENSEEGVETTEENDDKSPFANDDSSEADDVQKADDVKSVEDDDKSDEINFDKEDNDENDEEHEENEIEETDSAIEVEKLEKEVSDEDAVSEEQPVQETEEDDKSQEALPDVPVEDSLYDAEDAESVEDEEFLEDDIDEPLPVVERIVAPKGKPLPEVEDGPTTTKPTDTLADEEEYERQQEELRREQAEASHVWLKLVVGAALLVATHAVVSRAVAPRDETPASEDHAIREDTPLIDRRMTLVPEEQRANASPLESVEEIVRPVISYKQSVQNVSAPAKEDSEEDVEDEEVLDEKDNAGPTLENIETSNKELVSDDDEDEEELVGEEEIVENKIEIPKQPLQSEKIVEPEPVEAEIEEDVPDDVEIIDDEDLEEELEEEEDDEDEISDVDDAELLTRLEAKYGRLPDPETPQKHKDGGNSIEDDWPGEPNDKFWRQQLDEAEQELRQGSWSAALSVASAVEVRGSARARWLLARALDAQAEAQRDNRLLSRAIAAYLDVLKHNERLSDHRLRQIATRALDRIRFRGTYLSAEPVYRLLIRRFPDDVDYRNNLTVTFLMASRADLAEDVIKETLGKWPDDRVALAHLGFILKTQHNRLEEAVEAFQKALEGDVGPATEPRFYYHLGDSLLLLNRFEEAHDVHRRGAKLGHFLSPVQRSLYNVDRLKGRPWWDIEQTPYAKLARALENSWRDILREGRGLQALYEKEKEGLKERGEWSQLDLFVRGQEVPGRCKQAPVTCSIVKAERAASGCRRGQVKFSAMEAGTHVRPHVGPTNCRLRMHLGLSNTKDTYIRVDQETRQWQVGKVVIFDDSFEHEVWHNGTGTRLVLIVDVWHPELTHSERRDLPAI